MGSAMKKDLLVSIQDRAERLGGTPPYSMSTAIAVPELPDRAGALPERLQEIARSYLGARQRSGEALLESARWLSEARAVAIHGQWGVFLEATGTSDDT